MKKIAVAGATGYLGKYILKELLQREIPTLALVRNPQKLSSISSPILQIEKAEVTKPETLSGKLAEVDTLISAVGITRQKDGLTYQQVDYQANRNLLEEAQRAGVKKFIYVSAIGGTKYRHLQIFRAKEGFVEILQNAPIDYCVLRPNGFFSDMQDFLKMAKRGRIYLFGKGDKMINPIHGADLAEVVADAVDSDKKEIKVGGPDVLSQTEIAELALRAYQNQGRVWYLPDWIRRAIITLLRRFTSVRTYGPVEFFLTMMADNQVAPRYGRHRLKAFFEQAAKASPQK